MQKINGYLITLVILLVTLILGACQSATPEPSPVEVIEALEAAVNAKDLDALEVLFADDAVEYDGYMTSIGAEKIRKSYEPIVNTFSMDNTNIRVEGDKILYDCYLINDAGEVSLAQKYEAVIENGKISSNNVVGVIPKNEWETD